ncbi:N-alpha-acetyltransferase 60 [Hyposmocoma kahamanoa]|uniref:N-alpha-acetyltransferase 60 n=1 Tax=Hyposmocoma kahamanoa TaxID=1477025 RepID=UPI000E6D623D|nr:N-alpha-acetyltransferase 60 [Hyposmocoma kahamanoa]
MAGFSWYLSEGFQVIVEKSKESKCSLKDIQLRFLCPDDLEEVKSLCRDWFPIEYPQSWYEDITSSNRFFALAAVYKTQIIGLIVAEIKPYLKLNAEDRGILSGWFASKDTLVAYILSLGVTRAYRRSGVATMLLDVLINHLAGPMPLPPHEHRVKAIFLHVLTTNTEAILFYEQRRFRLHSFLPYYYSIKGRCKDGFTYVYYVNGGHAPWGLYDYVKYVARAALRGGGLYPWLWRKLRTALTIAWHRNSHIS